MPPVRRPLLRRPPVLPSLRSAAPRDSRYVTSGIYAIAHRGGAGLAPENTMAAFRASYDLGVRYLETDVRVTADGVPLAFHDATVDRMTCGVGKVAERDHATIRLLDVGGQPIPRIEDVLEEFPDARLVIDLKEPGAVGPLLATLRRTGATDRVCFAGAWDRLMATARELAGRQVVTTLGWESTTRLVLAARSGLRLPTLPPAEFVHVPQRLGRVTVFGQRLMSMAHDLGLKVIVWTIDDPFHIGALLDAGADGVITDRPDILRAVLQQRGRWPLPDELSERRAEAERLDVQAGERVSAGPRSA
jgi:glycerophosphoryl diester phosphodiesterase